MIFERRGIPTVFICAEGFTAAATAMARREGTTDYRYIVVPQPFSSLDEAQVMQRAREILPEVLAILGLHASERTEGAASE
jgi:hypothetical protein